MNKETVFTCDYSEIEQLVHDELGWDKYEFVEIQECSNDTSHTFDIDGKLSDLHMKWIDQWNNGECPNYTNYQILNYLCKLGYIEPGKYVVEVSW